MAQKNRSKNKQEKARRQQWRLCGLHRPAEPGGKARNYGLFWGSQDSVRQGHTRGCKYGFGVKLGVADSKNG